LNPSIQSLEKAARDLRAVLDAIDPINMPDEEWSALRLRIDELQKIAANADARRWAAAHEVRAAQAGQPLWQSLLSWPIGSFDVADQFIGIEIHIAKIA
jgi:hypothetical protein